MTSRKRRPGPKVRNAAPGPTPFAERLREHVESDGRSLAEVARDADLDPSVVSRLAAKDAGTRREPRLEQVIALARALGTTPAELIEGTDAASIFNDWVPRSQFDQEVSARLAAQRAVSAAEAEVARLEAQLALLRDEERRAQDALRTAGQRALKAESELTGTLRTVQHLETANETLRMQLEQAERAWADLQARLGSVQKQLTDSKQTAARNAGLALFGTLLGGVLGATIANGAEDDED